MEQKQSFNLPADFFSGFATLFIKLVFLIIIVYLILLVINFLRDKFINGVTETKRDDIADLLSILNRLFFISGFGFILANIIQVLLNKGTDANRMMSFGTDWDHLAFGIILIFVGIAFKSANKTIKQNRLE